MKEKRAVVIGTTRGRESWLYDCVKSIDVPIPVVVVNVDGFELGKIRWVFEHTKIDRFAFLQDSVVIRDNNILMNAFEREGSVCLFHDGICLNGYMGIYDRKVLKTMKLPVAKDKFDSIRYEGEFTRDYIEACGVDGFGHSYNSTGVMPAATRFKYGRENMVFTNPMMEKWKGNWGQMPDRDWQADDQQYHEFLQGKGESPFSGSSPNV